MERLSTKPNKMNVNEFLSLNAPVTPKSKNKKDNSSQNDLTPTSALRLDLANKFTISTPPEEKEKKKKIDSIKNSSKIIHYDIISSNSNVSFSNVLLKTYQKYLLPVEWNNILKKFHALETCTSMYMGRNQFFVNFDDVKQSIEMICKKNFSVQDLQMILYLVPDFYGVKWIHINSYGNTITTLKLTIYAKKNTNILMQKNKETDTGYAKDDEKEEEDEEQLLEEQGKDYQPGEKFMNTAIVANRDQIFRYKLVKQLYKIHEKWIKDNFIIGFDALEQVAWHADFNVDEINVSIPMKELPSKPTSNHGAEKLKDIMDKINNENEKYIQQQLTQKAATEAQMKAQLDENESDDVVKKPIASETSNIPEHLQHLNKNLLAKIRAKTQEKKILEGRYDKQHSKLQQQWESLPYLLNLIRGVYLAEKKNPQSHGKN